MLTSAGSVRVLARALAGNPRDHVLALTAVPEDRLHVVTRDASPFGTRSFVIWNPPLVPLRRSEHRRSVSAAGAAAAVEEPVILWPVVTLPLRSCAPPPPGRRDAAPDAGFSPVLEAVEIFIHLLEAGMRTILFGKVV